MFGQSLDVALCEKADVRVTGIQIDGNFAQVEYTWTCGQSTSIFELLRPILATTNFQFNMDTNLDRVLALASTGTIQGIAFFSLYDAGWRLEEVWDDVPDEW